MSLPSLSLLLQSWVCRQGITSPSVFKIESGIVYLSDICFLIAVANFFVIIYIASIRQQAACVKNVVSAMLCVSNC